MTLRNVVRNTQKEAPTRWSNGVRELHQIFLSDDRIKIAEPVSMSRGYYASRLLALAELVRIRAPLFILNEQSMNLVVDAAVQSQRFVKPESNPWVTVEQWPTSME